LAVPLAAAEVQVAEAGVVEGADEEAAAPVAAAADRLDAPTVDLDVRVVVSVPLPGVGGADRVHDKLLQDLGERPAPDAEEGQGGAVHAHVVVLPEGAGRLELAVLAAAPVGPVGLAPEGPFPLAGLLEEHAPGDRRVV